MRKHLVAAGAIALFCVAVPAQAAPHARAGGSGGPLACGTGHITWSPTTLWPPNHKLQTVTITYTGDNDGDTAMVGVTNFSDSDAPGGIEVHGSGQPDPQQGPDVVPGAPGSGPDSGPVTTTAQVRAERSGTGGGRVYTLTVSCTETDGDTGTAAATVTVPHDQGNHH